MSIASELTDLRTNISNAYDAINDKGGTIPANKNTANLASAIGSISGGGGKIGDFNIISGKVTPSAITNNIQVMTYDDFLAEVGGTMPSYVFLGIFDAEAKTTTQGLALLFGVDTLQTSPHYKNGSTTMTRGSLSGAVGANSYLGVNFIGYTGNDNGKFQAGVEYTWFILWKN